MLVLGGELALEKERASVDAKRGAHYIFSLVVFLGWKMCPTGGE